jgi:CheY-like chemotaxis protein
MKNTSSNPESQASQSAWQRPDENLYAVANQVVASQLASEFAWRLPVAVFLAVVPVMTLTVYLGTRDPLIIFFSLALITLQFLLSILTYTQRAPSHLYWLATGVIIVTFGWCLLVPTLGPGLNDIALALLSALVLLLVGDAWPIKNLLILETFALGVAIALSLRYDVSPLSIGLLIFSLLIAARKGAIAYISQSVRCGLPTVVRVCEALSSTVATVRVLAWELRMVADVPSVMLVTESQHGICIYEKGWQTWSGDPVFIQGLLQHLHRMEGSDGILERAVLGEQYYAALQEWFGMLPSSMFVHALNPVINDREEKLFLIVPRGTLASIAGSRRVEHALLGLVGAVRLSLGATRMRFESSDRMRSIEQTLAEREQDLEQIVHLVNNTAQEVTISCETARTSAPEDSAANAELRIIDATVRSLALGVSDTQWLREMGRTSEDEEVQPVGLHSILRELAEYARIRGERRAYSFVIPDTAIADELAIMVPNREHLGAALRLLIRIAERHLGKGGVLHCSYELDQEQRRITLRIGGAGTPFLPEELQALQGLRPTSQRTLSVYLSGVRRFLEIAEGNLKGIADDPDHFFFVLDFALGTVPQIRALPGNARWALLVDDKPEVTDFYARIADALQLAYVTAASVREAVACLETRGEPTLVITDLQLGDESGSVLVADIRKRFGKGTPVLVVSGRSDDGVKGEVRRAGATKHLTKPVSRQKLFAEIQEVLRM